MRGGGLTKKGALIPCFTVIAPIIELVRVTVHAS